MSELDEELKKKGREEISKIDKAKDVNIAEIQKEMQARMQAALQR